jgi:hypothetical protein
MIKLRVLSLGAGVQSTTLALMAAHGEITMPDCAVFADTQSEPQAVYEHLRWLMSPGVLPFPVHVVTAGSLRNQIVAGMLRHDSTQKSPRIDGRPPFFQRDGMIRRQCTHDFKVTPLNRKIRELAGLRPGARGPRTPIVDQWFGISRDEAQRMRTSDFRWVQFSYPLIDKGMTRRDCLNWLDAKGYARPKKSACFFCPYRSDAEWDNLRQTDWVAWDEAVEIDKLIRVGDSHRAKGQRWFLHRSLKPLDEVKLTHAERGQPDLFGNECQGMCGV